MDVSLFIVALTLAITSAAESEALFMEVDANGSSFKFTIGRFKELYNCVRRSNAGKCTISKFHYAGHGRDWVYEIDTEYLSSSCMYSSRFKCEQHTKSQLTCNRQRPSDDGCLDIRNCWTYRVNDRLKMFAPLEITWAEEHNVTFSDATVVNITACETACEALAAPPVPTWTTSTEAVYTPVTRIVFKDDDVGRGTTDINTGVEDPSMIITGVMVTVVAAVILVFGLLLWRSRRHAFTFAPSGGKHKKLSTPDSSCSVSFSNTDAKPSPNRSSSTTKLSSYTYITIDPSEAALSNCAVGTAQTDDPGYNNPDDFASIEHPQNAYACHRSVMSAKKGPSSCCLDNGQHELSKTMSPGVMLSFNGTFNRHVSRNDYSDIDDTFCVIDGASYVTSDSKGYSDVVVGPHRVKNPSTDITSDFGSRMEASPYACTNLAMLGSKGEYSKLYEPVRNIKEPYNVLPAEEEINPRDLSPTSTSCPQAPYSHSLALRHSKEALASPTYGRNPRNNLVTDGHDVDRCDLDTDQDCSANTVDNGVRPALNGITKRQMSRNEYSDIDDSFCIIDGTNYSIDDSSNNIGTLTNCAAKCIMSKPADAASKMGVTAYECCNLAESHTDTRGEYSRLYEPVRNIKDLYNVLPSSNDGALYSPSSLPHQDESPYCLAKPSLNASISYRQPIEVIDVRPPSRQQINGEGQRTSQDFSTTKDEVLFHDLKEPHSRNDVDGSHFAGSIESPSDEPSGQTNHYFELESNYDSDASEASQMEDLNPYSDIDVDSAVNPYDE